MSSLGAFDAVSKQVSGARLRQRPPAFSASYNQRLLPTTHVHGAVDTEDTVAVWVRRRHQTSPPCPLATQPLQLSPRFCARRPRMGWAAPPLSPISLGVRGKMRTAVCREDAYQCLPWRLLCSRSPRPSRGSTPGSSQASCCFRASKVTCRATLSTLDLVRLVANTWAKHELPVLPAPHALKRWAYPSVKVWTRGARFGVVTCELVRQRALQAPTSSHPPKGSCSSHEVGGTELGQNKAATERLLPRLAPTMPAAPSPHLHWRRSVRTWLHTRQELLTQVTQVTQVRRLSGTRAVQSADQPKSSMRTKARVPVSMSMGGHAEHGWARRVYTREVGMCSAPPPVGGCAL